MMLDNADKHTSCHTFGSSLFITINGLVFFDRCGMEESYFADVKICYIRIFQAAVVV